LEIRRLAIFAFLNTEKMSHQSKIVTNDRTETKGAELVGSEDFLFSGPVDG
jgi:hypothetical protein